MKRKLAVIFCTLATLSLGRLAVAGSDELERFASNGAQAAPREPAAAKAAACPTSCNAASLHGCYGFVCHGNQNAPNAAGPYANVGRIDCDGAGSCTGSGTVSLNGTVVPFALNASPYTVNPTCTGSGSLSVSVGGGPNQPVPFDFVLTNGGNAAYVVFTSAETIVTCEAARQ